MPKIATASQAMNIRQLVIGHIKIDQLSSSGHVQHLYLVFLQK